MKVDELIEKLKEFPGDLEVIYGDTDWLFEINSVELDKAWKENTQKWLRVKGWLIDCVRIK